MTTPMSAAGLDGVLARRWSEFVDCEMRSTSMRRFLRDYVVLDRPCRVVDLAAGIGCEVVTLAGMGCAVVGNEVSPALREVGQQRALRSGAFVTWTSYDWLTISERLDETQVDGAILLGNSLCLLGSIEYQRRAALQFHALLRPGARLAVDERNFRYIVNCAADILSRGFQYSATVIYCGTRVRGVPRLISTSSVVFEYEDTGSGAVLGSLTMRPYAEGELVSLFTGCGFRYLATLHDLQEPQMPRPDFLTYVFERI